MAFFGSRVYLCFGKPAMKYSILFIIFLSITALQTASAQDYANEKYIDIDVLGWKVKVNDKLIEGDTSILKKSLGLFGKELYDISHILPTKAVAALKNVTFWFETETVTHGYTGQYLGSRKWLIKHGANPEKARGIEIVAGRYIDAKAVMEDWVILHELAHAYHHLIFEYDERIEKAFKVIKAAGLYANVRQGFNKHHHGYALTNHTEYFAEITTMYFGHNSYYPFDRFDLKHYDPIGYRLVEELWEVNEK